MNFEEKFLPKNLWKESIYPKIFEKHSLPKNLCRETRTQNPKKVIELLSTKETLKRNFFQKISEDKVCTLKKWREITTQKSLHRNPYQQSLKRHSLPKDWKEESLLQNHWTLFLPKSLKTISPRKIVWREIYAKQISTQTSTNKVCDEIFLPEKSEEKSLKKTCQKKPSQKTWKTSTKNMFEEKSLSKEMTITFYPNISEEKTCTKQDVKGKSLANKIWIEISSNKFQKKPLPKNTWKKHAYPKVPLKKKTSTKKISLPKNCSNNLSSKNSTKLWGDILCQKKKWGNISTKQVFKRHFPTKKKISTKFIGKTISTKKRDQPSPPQNLQTIITRNMAKIRNDEIWEKRAYFVGISSLLILAIFWLKQFDFCSRRFLLKLWFLLDGLFG